MGLFAHVRARGLGWVKRGDARLLVLEVLKSKPMHGYEVGKAISQLFGGAYEPSPGVVYPNLQWLEDEGLLESVMRRGKKMYKLTEKGRRFAAEGKEELTRLLEIGRDSSKGGKWALMREGRQLTRLLAFAFPDLSDSKARKLASILQETRGRVEKELEQ